MTVRMTPQQLKDFLAKPGTPAPRDPAVLAAAKEKKTKAPPRRGLDMRPVLASLQMCTPRVRLDTGKAPSLTLYFPDVRMLSHNEILAILPYRKWAIYRYKAAWRRLVGQALDLAKAQAAEQGTGPINWQALFPSTVRLQLYRQARGSLDSDSASAVFKYAIDALVRNKVIVDDNRKILPSIIDHWAHGAPASAMRLEPWPDYQPPEPIDPIEQWLGPGRSD